MKGEAPFGPGDGGPVLALDVQREDIRRQLKTLRRKGERHLLWAYLGFSPAALIPALGLLKEGSIGLLLILSVLVTVSQVNAWRKTRRERKELREQLERLEAGG